MASYPVTYTYGRTLLRNELIQRREEGADPAGLAWVTASIDALDERLPRDRFADLYAALLAAPQRADWPYDEPSDLASIQAARPDGPRRLGLGATSQLDDRVHGAWLGRACGCLLGKPVEGWTRERIAAYLREMDAYPLADYVPAPRPGMPDLGWHRSAHEAWRGHIEGMARDDDMDYPILNLKVAEQHGPGFTPHDLAATWLAHLPYEGIYTAERLAYRNLVDEVGPPGSATRFNPYREWIGAQIRADLWGYLCPGEPERAAALAWRDASISHTANGIYGEMFCAALVAAAFAARDVDDALDAALAEVPARSRFAATVQQVRGWARALPDPAACRDRIEAAYGDYHWVHTLNNAAVVVMALAYCAGDYARGIGLAVMGGWDTDCNGATVGSVLGALHGTGGVPAAWRDPLHDRVRSFVIGEGENRISALAARTLAVALAER